MKLLKGTTLYSRKKFIKAFNYINNLDLPLLNICM